MLFYQKALFVFKKGFGLSLSRGKMFQIQTQEPVGDTKRWYTGSIFQMPT